MSAPVGTGRALGVLMSNLTGLDGIAMTTGGTAGFYGVAQVAQPANAAQAALTLTTGLQGASAYGFTTLTGFNAMTAQLENIRASLVLLGLLKGSA